MLTVDTYHKCPGTTAGQVSPQCLPNLSSCGLLPFCSLSFSQVDLCDQPYDLLLFVSDCAVAGTNGSPHQHHGRERALPDHWDHLWLLSLRPSVNPYQVANELGYQNLGEVVAFPGHFVFRSRQKARCRQLVSLDLILEAPRKEKGRIDFFSLPQSPGLLLILNSPTLPKQSFIFSLAYRVLLFRSKCTASLFLITQKKTSMYSSETAYYTTR